MTFALERTFRSLVDAAAESVGAASGGLVLVTPDRYISGFVPSAGTRPAESRHAIGTCVGGLLALALDSGPIRVGGVRGSAADNGFPFGIPAITTLLGIPVRVSDRTEGLLYVVNKRGKRGFDGHDENVVGGFARAVSVALENAQLVELGLRRERWLEAGAEVTRLLLGKVDRDAALSLVTSRIREICKADLASVALVDPADPSRLVCEAVDSVGAEVRMGARLSRVGVVDHVLESGRPVVSIDVNRDPRFVPAAEWQQVLPAMGVGMLLPLTAGDARVIGVLLVCWRRDNAGAQIASTEVPFVQALADQAALALQRVQSEAERERRERWLQVGSAMTRMLLADIDLAEGMRQVLRHLRKVSGADLAGVMLLQPEQSSVLAFVDGLGIDVTEGMSLQPRGLIATIIETGERIVTDDLNSEPGYDPPTPWKAALRGVGLGMLMPLVAHGATVGVLCAMWRNDSPQADAARREVHLVEGFATQTAVVLQQIRSETERARMRVLEDRDRIAQDLHDVVLRRLFAVQLAMQSAAGLTDRPEVQQRVEQAVADLDDITSDVRATVFELNHVGSHESPVRATLLQEIDAARGFLGFTPRLVIRGPVDEGIPEPVRGQLAPTVRTALANAATHPALTAVEVDLRVEHANVILTVHDDGRLPRQRTPTSYVADLQAKASDLGGACDVCADDGGSVLSWQVPLTD